MAFEQVFVILFIVLLPSWIIFFWYKYRTRNPKIKDALHTDITATKARDLHIYINSLAQYLDKNQLNRPHATYPIEGEENDVIFVHNLLSSEECNSLIAKTNDIGYISVEGFKNAVRSNKRCRTFDSEMSSIMFNRIKSFCPNTVIVDGHHWNIHSILPYWRYCKYFPSNHFSLHYDGSKAFENYAMSIFTINLYLNDAFQGGGTRFYMKCKQNAKENNEKEAGNVTHNIRPKKGGALIFNHCNKGYLHDGEALKNNEKYIMRADIIYKLRENEISSLQKREKYGECRFWSMINAKEHKVTNYVGRQWKCACVSHKVTVTLF